MKRPPNRIAPNKVAIMPTGGRIWRYHVTVYRGIGIWEKSYLCVSRKSAQRVARRALAKCQRADELSDQAMAVYR